MSVLDPYPPRVDGVHWMSADVTRLGELIEATKGSEVIYHLAAVSDVNIAFKDPVACVEANICGTTNVLEAARVNKISRVIFASRTRLRAGFRPTKDTGISWTRS